MKKIARDFKFILSAYLLFFIAMLIFVFMIPKGNEILWINHFKNPFFSYFFRIITLFGEWFLIVVLAIYLLWKNRKIFPYFALGFFLQLILSQFFKKFFDSPRPLSFFEESQLQLIENTPKLYHHSFPSGHTTTAFFLAFFVILFFKINRKLSLLFFVLAVLVGLSRIYLLAHFKEDILFGSILGLISAILPKYLFEEKNKI